MAAGGGGDAVAAAMIHAAEHGTDQEALILTYSWDRLLIDPRPGPRSAADFTGLETLAPGVLTFRPTSALVDPAGSSTLPRLSGEIRPAIALLDPYRGADSLTEQITAAITYTSADAIEIIDIGGDVIARGDEPGLRSPLADALTLAACANANVPTVVTVAGPGLDGELPEAEVLSRLGDPAFTLMPEQTTAFLPIFTWHPSEATALLSAAARGTRGICEIRDAGLPVALTDASPGVYRLDLDDALAINLLARRLIATTSLNQAEQITRDVCGFSELDHERNKSIWMSTQTGNLNTPTDLTARANTFLRDANSRGHQFVTFRRLAEALEIKDGFPPTLRATISALLPEPATILVVSTQFHFPNLHE
ncbi:DUF1152 domain-containing protein [Embleya sp. NPDC050154]|uniref:DUF1152 domain-containing protein n=1 Tax=Embleya sp. NPDC050154 TaxID=3363988 RepID=UPI00379ACF6C